MINSENNVILAKQIKKQPLLFMEKLIRYHSFEDLKGDFKPDNTNPLKSKQRQSQMENFLKLLRHNGLRKKNCKSGM
jgi:hypothetical protein